MNWLDFVIVGAYFAFFLWMGFFFKTNKNSSDYFLGGRSIGWFPLSLSTMATQLSAISFISAPAFVGLREGGGMKWLTYEFGVPLAMLFIMLIVIPKLYKAGIVSVYGYLEQRFSPATRNIVSVVFLVTRSFGTGVMVYAVAIIIQSVLNINFAWTILLIGVFTIFYSFQGGMKAVIWGDVIQMLILVAGLIICAIFGLQLVGGWDAFTTLIEPARLEAVKWDSFGFHSDEFGFWPMVIGGFFLYASYYGTDQTQSQRLLSAKDLPTVRKLLLANGLFRFPVTLIYCTMGLILGALLVQDPSYGQEIQETYELHSGTIKSTTDLLVPVFITKYLPNGVIGILFIAILSAAMSSLSSTINSLSAVTVEDFFKKQVGDDPTRYVRVSRYISIFWGVACVSCAFFVGDISDTVIEAINKISSLAYGPILAAFILALLSKRTSAIGMNVGLITGVAFNAYLWKFEPQVFWFWWNAIGCVVTAGIALGVSLVYPSQKSGGAGGLRWKELVWGKETPVLILYFGVMILIATLVPSIFS